MSGAHVHNFCGKDFEDLTKILNTLNYTDMIAYIEKCIRARETDFEFHEKMGMIKKLESDLKTEIEINKASPSSPVVKNLKQTIIYYQDKRKSHQIVIKTLKDRLKQIEKYYIKYGEKPVLIQDQMHKLFNAPQKSSVTSLKQSSVTSLKQPAKTQKQYAKIPQPISLASFIENPSKAKSKKATKKAAKKAAEQPAKTSL
jgi:hypothetical protein